ncbi:MAG TPA: DegT/DnrJ/EryC1/StrS family aminotransferase [Accumulibacter sp.]|jgi:dTDP-4-amino-4,6-dideoxygalactose transaminase|nr:DegT/DnrJ/EryC1/StrS family aminotransferase [Accumulibacter sp.]HQC79219.1 DegT/DnrJ/EryC1/StrS family aminotransferase [Accumulibacter sp.]
MKRCELPYASWGFRELRAAIAALASGQSRHGPAIGQLENQLGERLGGSRVLAVDSGRSALKIGLEALAGRRPERREVIVPAYICPAVVNAVKSAGLRPIPADVSHDLNLRLDSARERIGDRTLAIIVAHMYGAPADIAGFESLAKEAGIFLVDDAAQVVGETLSGRALGTFGDFGVLSFAQSKCLVTGESGGGGALICRNGDLFPELSSRVGALDPADARGKALIAFVWNYLLTPYTDKATYYWRRLRPATPHTTGPARIANLDAKTALCQLASLNNRRSARLVVLDGYARQLETQHLALPQYAPDRYLARVMVRLPPGTDIESCRQYLRRRAVTTRPAYPPFLDETGSSAYAREIAPRLLELPAAASMTGADITRVCEHLGEAMRRSAFD